MRDVMIDIETLGTQPGCAVIAVGAVEFNPFTQELGRSFYGEISRTSNQFFGLYEDPETLEWWGKQPIDAKELIYRVSEKNIKTDLVYYLGWLSKFLDRDNVRVWANSPSFDLEILKTAFGIVDLEVPWKFHEEADCRTIVALGRMLGIDPKKNLKFEGEKHHALHDAIHQARYVSNVISSIKLRSDTEFDIDLLCKSRASKLNQCLIPDELIMEQA